MFLSTGKKYLIRLLPFLFTIAGFFFAFSAKAIVDIAPASNTNQTPQTVNEIFMGFALGNQSGFFPILVIIGLVTFLTGVVRYAGAGDNEEKRAQGRNVMIFGIIVLFVMVSMWGFVKILTQSFLGKDPQTPNYLPKLL